MLFWFEGETGPKRLAQPAEEKKIRIPIKFLIFAKTDLMNKWKVIMIFIWRQFNKLDDLICGTEKFLSDMKNKILYHPNLYEKVVHEKL